MTTTCVKWYRVGDGVRLHAKKDGAVYTVCRIRGVFRVPFDPEGYDRCKACERKLTPNIEITGINKERGQEMDQKQQESFKQAALPLIKWINENGHPHHSVIVTPTSAEFLEGVCSTGKILDYVKD